LLPNIDDPSVELKVNFNQLFDTARVIDRTVHPHPITKVPPDILREIFDTVAHVDPDAPLVLLDTCPAWKNLVLETPSIWSNIHIAVDQVEALEALCVFLCFSKGVPLDISLVGGQTPSAVLIDLSSHVNRIRSLYIRLRKKARESFHHLSKSPPDGLCSLSLLALDAPTQAISRTSPSSDAFVLAAKHGGALDVGDFTLIQALPLLSSLSSLVLHDVEVTDVPLLVLPSMKSLHLILKELPTLLGSFKCNNLETLDVVLNDTSQEGWRDLLLKSLVHPRLLNLTLDVTLDRKMNDWSAPWHYRDAVRLPRQAHVSTLTITLAFSDQEYRRDEYLCGDLLEEFLSCFPSLADLRLLHVPFLHSPWVWPSAQMLQNLQHLELQVPSLVYGGYQPEIELPTLRELRYYGFVSPRDTRLLALRTPFLQFLEIMHHEQSIHPFYVQVDRRWSATYRHLVNGTEYSTSKNNSSKNFPEPETPSQSITFLPVVYQSTALRELRIFLGTISNGPTFAFKRTKFPLLRTLYCSAFHLGRIEAPQLEELHLMWSPAVENVAFEEFPRGTRTRTDMLRGLRLIDFYSHFDPKYHEEDYPGDMTVIAEWMKYLDSLQVIVLARAWRYIDQFIPILRRDPRVCPKLTTIDSFAYPHEWSALRDCLEVRNHHAMRDRTTQPIQELIFPLVLHPNIATRLKDALSGRFASDFVPIPHQPWALVELLSPNERAALGQRPDDICFGCLQSGNAPECMGLESELVSDSHKIDCSRHRDRLPGRGSAITAYIMELSGYLEKGETEEVEQTNSGILEGVR